MTITIGAEALGRLRQAKATANQIPEVRDTIAARDRVFARYSPMFQPAAISTISEEALRSFLYVDNNMHWTGLNRQVNRICADMDATRSALHALVDETQPIETRMVPATDIKGLVKGIITAILHVAYPDKYGVWNSTSEGALVDLALAPDFPRGAGFGERYALINLVFADVANVLDVDFWTLDALWWNLDGDSQDVTFLGEVITPEPPVENTIRFALERHLHNFLFDNWEATSLGQEWDIFARPGEPDAGYEFPTPIGRIDLLARHRTQPRWLVIELKRNMTSDQVVGQVLRYIGWLRVHQAEADESVEGLIIAQGGDPKLHYAISAVQELSFMSYEVDFRLNHGPVLHEYAKP